MEGSRGGTATGGLRGMVALARSIVTPSAPCMRWCMGSRPPCCATTAAPLAGRGMWSSCVLLLCQDLLWGRAIPISAGCASVVRHPLLPLARATLRTGMQRGMVDWGQMGRRSRCVIHCHRCEGPLRGLLRTPVRLPCMRTCRVRWPSSMVAGVRWHSDIGLSPCVGQPGRRQETG
jgi:hypothetical protein